MVLISKEATIEAMCADCQGKCVPCEAWPCDEIKVVQNMPAMPNGEMDETFRIASEVRIAVGCKTAKECWELARNGEIQRVKHGRWIEHERAEEYDGKLSRYLSICILKY